MVHTARAVVPHMRKAGGGAMVHFSTIQCLRGDPVPQDAYSTSKAGVGALSRSLAMQLAGDQIRSNAIYPGPTLTPMQDRWNTAEKIAAVGQWVLLGRAGEARTWPTRPCSCFPMPPPTSPASILSSTAGCR